MNNYSFVFIIIAICNYVIGISSKNNYYIISIRRNINDTDYDKAINVVQNEIDELVNERMNDIYNIIINNKDTYILENGEIDEKLNEIKHLNVNSKNKKFKFINKNRPENNLKIYTGLNNKYIPIESKLINHICPILNYYAIKAYLSDSIVEIVKQLPNIISCEKSTKLEKPKFTSSYVYKKKKRSTSSSKTYFDIKYIQKETNWTNVSIQRDANLHLSLISQYKYDSEIVNNYDDNYYYPSTAGKGIDIYIIDDGLYVNHEDFDTYNGERTVTCDAIVKDGIAKSTDSKTKKSCSIGSTHPEHGILVSSIAGGKIYGVAKKANIHMINTDYNDYDFTAALDYIKEHGRPYKSVINISRGGTAIYSKIIQGKINELTNAGFIIFVASGNEGIDVCYNRNSNKTGEYNINAFSGYNNVISVGGTYNDVFSTEDSYTAENESNYGYCVDFYAPYYVVAASIDCYKSYKIYTDNNHVHGTSFSSPIVAGVAALIMAEHPEIKYDYQLIRKTLIDLSVKNIITKLQSSKTPNRFINNGKRIVYSSDNKYYGCGITSGNHKCSSGCCSKNGTCIDPTKDTKNLCKIENGCQSEFGKCSKSIITIVSPRNSYGMTVDNAKKSIKNSSLFESLFLK